MSQDNRRYGWAATTLLVVLAAAIVSRRSISAASPVRPAPAATFDAADSLARYLTPVSDAAVWSQAPAGAVTTDPFRATPVPMTVVQAPPRPAVGSPAAPARGGWSLTAILITEARRAAVIDERLVSVGDRLPGGARVVAVERDHVVVMDADGGRHQLNLSNAGGV